MRKYRKILVPLLFSSQKLIGLKRIYLLQHTHTIEQEKTGKTKGQMVEGKSREEEVRHGQRPD